MRTLPSLATAAFCALLASSAMAAPWDKPGYDLTFHDEFDGSSLDTSLWLKRYKWGEAVVNEELQAYVDDAFSLDGGILHIVATKAPGTYGGQSFAYRSGLIASVHEQTYGLFEMRCRFPKGKGFWPAFWLLGATGPGVNEIDIHEFLGDNVNTVYTTVHWGESYSVGHQSDGEPFVGPDFTADFHTFAVEWDPASIVWTVDGAEVHRHTGVGVPQVPMYVIANLAVGGNWPGAPTDQTVFPSTYDIDYIRAYQLRGGQDAGSGGAGGASSSGGPEAGSGGGSSEGSSDGSPPAGDAGEGGSGGDKGGAPGGCGCDLARQTTPLTAWIPVFLVVSALRARARGRSVRRNRALW